MPEDIAHYEMKGAGCGVLAGHSSKLVYRLFFLLLNPRSSHSLD
jgi:hypothetical protein